MRENKLLVLGLSFLTVCTFTIAVAVPCACGPELKKTGGGGGGFAFASFGNGAAFTWDNYVPPTVTISGTGSTTVVTTTPGYFKNMPNTNSNKFMFKKDMYVWTSMNKINPDIVELQKVLASEGLLGQNSKSGVYDTVTKTAVEAFQKKYKIAPAPQYSYGYFGPKTRAFINNR